MRFYTLIVIAAVSLAPLHALAQDAGAPPPAEPARPKLSAKDQKLVDKKLEQAGKALEKKEVDKAEKLLGEVLAKAPGHELATLQLAEILSKTERNDKALELVEAAVNGPLVTERLILFYGGMLERARRQDDAKVVLARGAASYPRNVHMRVRLGQLSGLQDKADAEKWYKEVLAIETTNRTANNNLAVIYTSDARYSEALPLLQVYERTNPNAASGRFNLASTYLALGKTTEAEAVYDALLTTRPEDAFAIQGKAMTLTVSGKPDEARKFIVGKVGLKATQPQVVYAMALALLFEGKAKEAEEVLSQSVAGPRGQTWHVMARTEALRQLGRVAEAEKLIVDHMDGSNIARPHALPYLALVRRDQGKTQEARALLEEAFGLQRDYKQPEDLRYLVRMPPIAVGAVKTALGPDPAPAPVTPVAPPTKQGCACSVGPNGGGSAVLLFLLGALFLRRK